MMLRACSSSSTTQPRRTPLYDRHVAARRAADRLRRLGHAGAVLRRSSTSTRPCARRPGIFDVSHMGEVDVRGAARARGGAAAGHERRRASCADGKARLHAALPTRRGGIVDDCIVYARADRRTSSSSTPSQHRQGPRLVPRARARPLRRRRPSPTRPRCSRCRARRPSRWSQSLARRRASPSCRVFTLHGATSPASQPRRRAHRLHRRGRLRALRAAPDDAARCGTRCSRPGRPAG